MVKAAVMFFSFIFDTITPQKRATCLANYNIVKGLALISGALHGSAFVSGVQAQLPARFSHERSFADRVLALCPAAAAGSAYRGDDRLFPSLLKVVTSRPTMCMV